MSRGWERDKRWSDKFLPHIKSILGQHLIGEPPQEEDQMRNTDLMVLKMEAVRIACRIRTPGYYDKYGGEFTIREGRPTGHKTELTKIIEGWGHYFFYGHAGDSDRLLAWGLGDLNVFRIWHSRELVRHGGVLPGKQQNNHDNSSSFRAFRWAEMPVEFIVASENLPLPVSAADAA